MMRKICILVPLLLLLPPVCGQGLRTDNFTHYDEKMHWYQAQDICRTKHTDLVTIRNEIENLGIVSGQAWIGLYRENSTSNWKWSRRDEIATFINWAYNEPKNGEDCGYRNGNTGGWGSDRCDNDHTYVCFDERLVLVRENKTWEEALQYCRALEVVDPSKPATAYKNNRYDLATLLTDDDHVFAREKAQGATTDEVWTGLRYLAGQWLWVGGGGGVQHTNIQGCPTQMSCGVLLKTGTTLFDIRDCSQRKNFFCYKKPYTHVFQ